MTVRGISYAGQALTTAPAPLPDFSPTAGALTTYLPTPNDQAPSVQDVSGIPTLGTVRGWGINPTVSTGGQRAGYHQWNVGRKPLSAQIKFVFTENKTAKMNGPVLAFLTAPLTVQGSGFAVPPFAAHFGLGKESAHIDVAWFFGLSAVKNWTFSPVLQSGVVYTMAMKYVAADTIQVTLPDGRLDTVQHSSFSQNAGNWCFSEVYLGNPLIESNCLIVEETFDDGVVTTGGGTGGTTVQKVYEPYCRNHALTGPVGTAAAVDTWAQDHATNNAGHVVEVRTLWAAA